MSDNLFSEGAIANIGEEVDGHIKQYSPKFQVLTRMFMNEIRLRYHRIEEELKLLDELIGSDISEEVFVSQMDVISEYYTSDCL